MKSEALQSPKSTVQVFLRLHFPHKMKSSKVKKNMIQHKSLAKVTFDNQILKNYSPIIFFKDLKNLC